MHTINQGHPQHIVEEICGVGLAVGMTTWMLSSWSWYGARWCIVETKYIKINKLFRLRINSVSVCHHPCPPRQRCAAPSSSEVALCPLLPWYWAYLYWVYDLGTINMFFTLRRYFIILLLFISTFYKLVSKFLSDLSHFQMAFHVP